MNKFKKLGLKGPILKILEKEGIVEPTEIQTKSIPLVIEGHDLIGGSATGSGKTLAFSSAIIKNCERKAGIQALVLTPTRELAIQVSEYIYKFSKHKQFNITEVYGGVSFDKQANRLKSTDVVVATPGRLLDHMRKRTIDLSKLKILVIDEADRMLDMGFIRDVRKIIEQCPIKRQTLLFSATITNELKQLSKKYMKNPKKVSAKSYVDPKKLKQVYYDIIDNKKISLLAHLLKKDHSGTVMVFCNTKRTVNFVVNNLKQQDVLAHAIHGGFTQARRSNTLEKFHDNKIKVLVCTDVAARGLDIKGVSHVYNFDIPKEIKQYIHRIGRTARAGKDGMAVNLLSRKEHNDFKKIIKTYNVDVEKKETPEFKTIKVQKSFRKKPNKQSKRRKKWHGRRMR